MIEVGIRELKSRLSYYVQLMQAGETISIKLRDQVIGFLSHLLPPSEDEQRPRRSTRSIKSLLAKWRENGFLVSGGLYRKRPFKAIRLKGVGTAAEMIRSMRDEER